MYSQVWEAENIITNITASIKILWKTRGVEEAKQHRRVTTEFGTMAKMVLHPLFIPH